MPGVCDLTVRHRASRVTSVRNATANENVLHVINAVKVAIDLLTGLGTHRVIIATIIYKYYI